MDRNELATIGKAISNKFKRQDGGVSAAEQTSAGTPHPEKRSADSATATQSIVRSPEPPQSDEVIEHLTLDLILASPYQPRRKEPTKKDVEELASNIAANGQTTPIIVTRADGDQAGSYYVHSGHRRCAALKVLGWKSVKAIVRTDLDERHARRLALMDNLGREDLGAYEQAMGFKDYCEACGLDVAAAAQELGLTRRHAGRLSAITKASPEMLEFLREHGLTPRVAEPLVKLDQRDARKALRLARRYVSGQVSFSAVEAEVACAVPSARAPVAKKDVELNIGPREVRLALRVPRGTLSGGQRERVSDAFARCLGVIGIEEVRALHPEADEGDAALA